jgi:hypothetical protein
MNRLLLGLGVLALFAAEPGLAADPADLLRGPALSFPYTLPEPGQELELVGHIDAGASRAPFPMADGAEYTWSIYGPVVHAVDHPSPGITVRWLTFGVLEIREDVSPDADFSAFPPNRSVPSSFHDGSVLLLAQLTDLRLRDVFGLVTAHAAVHFVSGSAAPGLGDLVIWSLTAAVSEFGDPIPPGYGSSWRLELTPLAPVGVEEESWGAIKALYR